MADSTNIPHQSFDPSSSAGTSMDVSRSTNSSSSYNYEVFISHHGKDVKNTLASHLYRRLGDRGFRAFLDRDEMRVGENIRSQLKGVIATADVHIAIFSPRYAQSEWCLNELVEMLNQMENRKTPIIPIFYNVDPCALRIRTDDGQLGLLGQILKCLGYSARNNGVYAEALQGHVKKGRYPQEQIADWKKALFDVSLLSGLELKKHNSNEGELLDIVLQRVEENVKKPHLYVAKYPTGLDKKLQDFEETVMLQQPHSEEPKVVGIVGSGGVGKTTLATEFFNRERSAYNRSCFLRRVRIKTLLDLQNKLLKDLISQDLRASDIVEAISELSHRLSRSKALVVLDDVDDAEQLKALFSPLKEALRSDSLILLTSRNRDLLSCNGVSSIYKLLGLDREESQRLFCLHAFPETRSNKVVEPRAGFKEVVTKFLDACDGLPLSLEVLGSHLSTKDLEYWKGQLQKISDLVLPQEIKDSLMISYDRLDDQEKEVFLDIACFLIEEDEDKAISVWDGSVNLKNLKAKCIVQTDSQKRIRMHNHLRDLGRTLAKEELHEYPCRPLRLWNRDEDIFYYASLRRSVRGINMVEGVSDQSFLNSRDRPSFDMSKLQLLRAEGDCLKNMSEFLTQTDQLVWLCWNKCPDTSLPSWLRIQKLRALRMSGGELETTCCDRESVAPLLGLSPCVDLQTQTNHGGDSGEVQRIILNGCSSSEFLSSCPLQLEHLDLQGTKIKEVSFPEGFCRNLKHLNLRFCRELREVGALPKGLISLNLEGSTTLKKISGLPGLTDLRRLDISGCNELEELPGLDTLPSSLEVKGKSECRKLYN